MIGQDLFSFGEMPYEKYLSSIEPGGSIGAVALLTQLEGENEETLDNAFFLMEQRDLSLDISDLPKNYAAAGQGERLRLEESLQLPQDAKTLEETDPLRIYLEELALLPVNLPEQVLLDKMARELSEQLQNQLMEASLHRVVELSAEFTGHGVLLLDLIQEGNLGLWSAIAAHVPGKDFFSARDWWIRQLMARAVVRQAMQAGVGSKLRQAMEDYRNMDEQLLSQLGRNPTVEEIADALHISAQEASAVSDMLDTTRAMQRVKAPEAEVLPQEEDQAVEDTAYFQMRQRIEELLSTLTPEDAKLLSLRYGLEGGLPMKPQQVAQQLNMTPDEVNAREAAALAMLRNQ